MLNQKIINAIAAKNIETIAKIIAESKDDSIDLQHNILSDEVVQQLALGLEINTSIRFLYLDKCSISDKAGQYLATMFQKNNSLRVVNLNNNFINESAKKIALALKQNTSLQTLFLRWNRIDDNGAIAFANNLSAGIETLHFSFNPTITDETAKSFVETLSKSNTLLTELDLYVEDSVLRQQLDCLVAKNHRKEHKQFLQNMLLLANDFTNLKSESFFSKLPLETVLLIVSFYPLTNNNRRAEFNACAKFIFKHIKDVKPFLKKQCGAHILQKKVEGALKFSFFCRNKSHKPTCNRLSEEIQSVGITCPIL